MEKRFPPIQVVVDQEAHCTLRSDLGIPRPPNEIAYIVNVVHAAEFPDQTVQQPLFLLPARTHTPSPGKWAKGIAG